MVHAGTSVPSCWHQALLYSDVPASGCSIVVQKPGIRGLFQGNNKQKP